MRREDDVRTVWNRLTDGDRAKGEREKRATKSETKSKRCDGIGIYGFIGVWGGGGRVRFLDGGEG